MNSLRFLLAALMLSVSLGAHAADKTVEQDGIQVRKSIFLPFAPRKMLEQQAGLQYTNLLDSAQQQHALLPDNHPTVQRVRAVARRLIPFAGRWNANAAQWRWQVNVLNSGTVNAFCMPGGRIAFYTGIVDKLHMTDDEVAAVMGHEMAHALLEHGAEQYVKSNGTALGTQVVGALIGHRYGIDPHLTSEVARGFTQLASLKYSRDDEREADLVGLDIASRAGFDPRAGIVLWQKMGALNKSSPPALLSTHPLGPERIAQIQSHLPVLMPLYARAKNTTVAQLPPYRGN